MSDKRKIGLNKPPVPARPKNLVVLNSKHLPKPPEIFSVPSKITKQFNPKKNDTVNSDGEEDAYGYLEPLSLSTSDINSGTKNMNGSTLKKSIDENLKLGEIFDKIMMRSNSSSVESPEGESIKHQMPVNQWQRPLPLPPTEGKSEVTSMPWYKKIDRKKGEEILRNGIDGYFLVRPSSNADTYLTLTLWYNNRTYNIPIRKRKDGKFALGTPKTNEQCFDSIEYMVKNYQSEKLVLYSNGVQTGKTLLTKYPP
ncbi:sh2 domain containing protein, putative [Pediculus humanus corporis]|uniref:Sh2 domain containing protein, putative n=1 Tax=Pediculus humanus subsp. corporis TaxID=121224 RepID=E0VE57_PEDHC|nr:sh2 domain containing protein, putative [Pediculus humanus corporis]EEB11663.1 sh2 domain containing protein, putative [Pediculus humanus corporis]